MIHVYDSEVKREGEEEKGEEAKGRGKRKTKDSNLSFEKYDEDDRKKTEPIIEF